MSKDKNPSPQTQLRADCPECHGTGEVFGHADDCHDDLCALNGDIHSCSGKVEPCGCTAPPQPHAAGLSLASLQRSHVERQEEWCPDQKPDLSFRGNELGGECGEAQNVIKKLERERHGWRGSRDTVEHLAEELADVIHCAVLVAITAGIDIEPAVIAKFNSTSEKNGLSTFLAATATEADHG